MRRIAADGKPFDQDFLGRETWDNEVEVIQYLRPNGVRRRMTAPCRNAIIAKVWRMIVSAEVLPTQQIAIWVRGGDEPEENEILDLADNGPGERSPDKVLEMLIDKKFEQLMKEKEIEDEKTT